MLFKKIWVNVMPTVCVAAMLISAETMGQSAEVSKIDSTKADSSMKAMDMKMHAQRMEKDTSIGYWTCPMHPEIHKAGPGDCPICGMNLVLKKSNKNTNKMKCMDTCKMMRMNHGKMKCMDTCKMMRMNYCKMKCMGTSKMKCMDSSQMKCMDTSK